MLNNKGERELAYLVRVGEISEMNADRLECAHLGGWHCVVGKGEFKSGDLGVYFEIDSQLPDVEPFSQMDFLRSKHFNIKTQKIRGEYSQGLLMPISAFGWTLEDGRVVDGENTYCLEDESRFLTKRLGVTYTIPKFDAPRAVDKYKKMAQRHPKLAKTKLWRRLYRTKAGKKILFIFFGAAKKKVGWPYWVVKTDEERCQNMPYLFPGDDTEWIVTEKIDGTSTTFTYCKDWLGRGKFYVCSRNVCFDKPDKQCYYDTNVYLEMAEKYHMKDALKEMYKIVQNCKFVTVQGETYGKGIQSREYGLEGHDLAVFNVIFGYKNGKVIRLNPEDGEMWMKTFGVPYVPVLGRITLPETCEQLLKIADGESKIDGKMREGIVLRTEDGQRSFKAVSNKYLMKVHG